MDFLGSIAVEVIAAVVAAGLVGALGWLGARLWRRRREGRAAEAGRPGAQPVDTARGGVRPLRVLVAASRPWDVEPWLDSEGEWEALCAALRPRAEGEAVPVHLEFLPAATPRALQAGLQHGCDVLHFAGHGTPEGHLVLEDDYGLAQPMDAESFLRLLPAERAHCPRLVMLSACHSGTVGATLRKVGVAHVVAVDPATPVPSRAAAAYAAALYRALARGGRLGHAHRDGQNAAGLDKYTGDGSPLVEGPPVSGRFQLLTRNRRVRLARGRRGLFTHHRPPVAGVEFPPPRVSLVGRARDLGTVTYLLAESRLVTVHGLGGVGKTALARALARRLWETARFPGGLAWVGLEGREGAAGLLEGLRARLAPDFSFPPEAETAQERAAALAGHLAARWADHRGLWVLDNFETVHGPEGVAVLRALLEGLPDLRVLVTARHALGLPEEARHLLRELAQAQAVALFEARCGVPLAAEEQPAVEAICERLDRLPLAVEQAALRVDGQSPGMLLEGLERSALALTPAEEAAYPERQRGLAVNFRYNFERLGEAGRRLWCCFAVFLGQPTHAALAQVAGFARWEQGRDELARWHLARREGERYTMLPTVREYGALMLREVGADLGVDAAELRARHAAHYLAYAQAHRDEYDALQRELPDIFAGFDFVATEATRDEEAVRDYTRALDHFFYTRGYWSELLSWSQECIQACEALGDRAGLATTYNNIGLIHKARGDYEAALEWYEKSVALKEALGDRAGLATTYNNIGLIHKARGDYDAALAWYEKSGAIAEELGDRAGLAATYNNIASVHYARGDYEAALGWYEKSVALKEALGDRAGLATTYNNIGLIHDARGDYEAALEWYEKSVAIKEGLGDRAGLATTYNNIGEVHRARGDYEAALGWYEKSVALKEALGDRAGLATTYNNIGEVHRARGDYEAALEWYEKSVAIKEGLGDRAGLATTYNNIGEVHRARGDYEAALGWYEKSVAITEALGDRAGLATTYDNVGGLYFAQGDYANALEWQKKALEISLELGASGALIYRYFNVGTDLLKLGRRREAMDYVGRAFRLCDQLGLPHLAEQMASALAAMGADASELRRMRDTTAD